MYATYDEYTDFGYSFIPESVFERYIIKAGFTVETQTLGRVTDEFLNDAEVDEVLIMRNKRGICEIAELVYLFDNVAVGESGSPIKSFSNEGYSEQMTDRSSSDARRGYNTKINSLTAEQLALFLIKNNPSPKINCTAMELTRMYIEEGNALNIRGDIAFCQAIQETGWFKYGGLVLPEQNNYCGLGATNDSSVGKGVWFNTPREGVRAQIQHLYAYASNFPLPSGTACIDPRFSLVTRGDSPFWEGLGGKWAWPGYDAAKYKDLAAALAAKDTYGHYILAIYAKAEAFAQSIPPQPVKTPEEITVDNAIADGIIGDRAHWLGVLNGTVAAVPEYVKIVLDRYHDKLKS